MKPHVTTKVRPKDRSVLDAITEVVAKYESEKRWGQVTLTFQAGKAIVLETKETTKLSG